MHDSHYSQICFLDSKLKLGIQEQFDRWHQFLEITERRNLFVHTGGLVSPAYMENCKKWNIPLSDEIKEGHRLLACDKYILNSSDCFYEMSVRLVQVAARRLFPANFKELDETLNNKTADLLIAERWSLAERIFEFALTIPKKFRTSGEMEYYWLINLCIALKFSDKKYKARLHSVDWAPFHPKYHFAVAILEDRFDDAERLMRSEAVQAEVTERNFKDWPLLREFRKTDAFQQAFKDIFNKDYADQLLRDAVEEIKAEQSNAADILSPDTLPTGEAPLQSAGD